MPKHSLWNRRIRKQALRAVQPQVRRVLLGVVFLLAAGTLFTSTLVPATVSVQLGEPTHQAIKAPRDFIDRPSTRALQDKAAAAVDDSFTLDGAVTSKVVSGLSQTLTKIGALRAQVQAAQPKGTGSEQASGGTSASGSGGSKAAGSGGTTKPNSVSSGTLAHPGAALSEAAGLTVGDKVAAAVLSLSQADWAALRTQVAGLVSDDMNKGIGEDSLDTFQRDAQTEVLTWNYAQPVLTFAANLVQHTLQPNVRFDAVKTQQARDAARAAVTPVTFVKGQTIIADGDIVTASDLERLEDAGLLRSSRDHSAMVAAFLLAGLLEALMTAYLIFFKPQLWANERRVFLVALALALMLVVSRLALPISAYLTPIAWGAMLLAILIGPEVALVSVLFGAVALGFMAGHDLRFAFVAIVGGFAAVFSVRRVDARNEIMRAGFFAALGSALAVAVMALLSGGDALSAGVLGRDLAYGVVNGVLSGMLTIGALPYAEQLFGILTSVRLLELSNPNQPLLRRMLVEAPGTYHHSLMVANLCEAACEAVHGNALLARVAAYYHDIGKLKRPYFFVDNQFGGENPHDKLSPNLSALIITSHVKDGVDMAREAKLPEAIVDFIREHHGTLLASYFYNKAVEQSEGPVDEAGFRYPGPRPQSKEAAIMMLADGSEASVRALNDPTPDRIEAQVRKIIKERLDAGQLDQADITLKDLDTIAATFTHVLMGLHHQRIQYPEKIAEELQRGGDRHERGRRGKGFLRVAGGRR